MACMLHSLSLGMQIRAIIHVFYLHVTLSSESSQNIAKERQTATRPTGQIPTMLVPPTGFPFVPLQQDLKGLDSSGLDLNTEPPLGLPTLGCWRSDRAKDKNSI